MSILKKRWFWIAVIVLLIFTIIFDLILLNLWAIHSISSGQWDMRLLITAGGLILSDAVGSVYKKWKLVSSPYTKLVFFLLIISAIIIHGFWNGFIFMSLTLILSRLIRLVIWVIKKLVRSYQRRHLLEEI